MLIMVKQSLQDTIQNQSEYIKNTNVVFLNFWLLQFLKALCLLKAILIVKCTLIMEELIFTDFAVFEVLQ